MIFPLSPIVDRVDSSFVCVQVESDLRRIVPHGVSRCHKGCREGTHEAPHSHRRSAPKGSRILDPLEVSC